MKPSKPCCLNCCNFMNERFHENFCLARCERIENPAETVCKFYVNCGRSVKVRVEAEK